MFKELFKRADFTSIAEFIMNGGELVELPKEQPNEEKIKQAYEKIYGFINANFKAENRDEKADNLTSAIGDLETAYFELGLLSGLKIGAQLQNKISEIL